MIDQYVGYRILYELHALMVTHDFVADYHGKIRRSFQ
jgi:hypothetical protein